MFKIRNTKPFVKENLFLNFPGILVYLFDWSLVTSPFCSPFSKGDLEGFPSKKLNEEKSRFSGRVSEDISGVKWKGYHSLTS